MRTTYLMLMTALFVVASCTQTPKHVFHQSVEPPLKEAQSPVEQFTLQAEEGGEITTTKGSKITIPASAFVDADGNPVAGEVQISFSEYHSHAEIILSGIPMGIQTEEGEYGHFESAGMFSIEGEQAGKTISVAEGKKLDVNLVSYKAGNDFNFYSFDEDAGNWVEEVSSEQMERTTVADDNLDLESDKGLPVNPMTPEHAQSVQPVQPVQIRKATSSDKVFELAIDKKRNPEFRTFDNVMWRSIDNKEVLATEIRNPELTCTSPEESTYELKGDAKGQTVRYTVQPVMFGSNYKKAHARFQEQMKSYNKQIEERKQKEEERLKQIEKAAELRRAASVSGFGTYNFDKLYHLKRAVKIIPTFFVPLIQKTIKRVYMIIKDDDALIEWGPDKSQFYTFTVDPKSQTMLVSIDEDGQVYEFSSEQFESLDFKSIKRSGEYTFNMNPSGATIANSDDLSEYLSAL